MREVLPAIIGKTIEDIAAKTEELRGLVDWVQIDVIDGEFSSQRSWPFTDGSPGDLSDIALEMNIELHLMIKKPEHMIEEWLESGAKRILVHYESTPNLDDLLMVINGSAGVEAGIAILMDTPVEALYPFLGSIKYVQFMSIAEIGAYGIPFDDGVYERIIALRSSYPDLHIAVDGGVTLRNAPHLIAAGADALVVGSAIWKSGDVARTIKEFQNM
ncbi:MAG: hypothetical protein HYS59_01815 [Candidatus Vogelbacteria bacterium]|nr:hypothetical protein [Candidatus Vogelbacteria bacterium]